MIQEIIAYGIIVCAFIVAGVFLYRKYIRRKTGCSGCSTSDCGGCPLEELKKEIEANKK